MTAAFDSFRMKSSRKLAYHSESSVSVFESTERETKMVRCSKRSRHDNTRDTHYSCESRSPAISTKLYAHPSILFAIMQVSQLIADLISVSTIIRGQVCNNVAVLFFYSQLAITDCHGFMIKLARLRTPRPYCLSSLRNSLTKMRMLIHASLNAGESVEVEMAESKTHFVFKLPD